jgi:NAD(P)H-dependent flavin oxidoreductase YrpB (nitropropane dioxygenase family)
MMTAPLAALGLTCPVLAAPMAGGPMNPALAVAAARAGSLGFLAGGYKTPALLAQQIAEVRAQVPAFGVNLFAPNPVPVDVAEFRRYAAAVQAEADAYGLRLEGTTPVEDDDAWSAKVDLLVSDPVPAVSFTFGLPDRSVITALKRAGTLIIQTVTSAAEARLAAEAGADVLAVQALGAGGHSGTLTPQQIPAAVPLPELTAAVAGETGLPVVAAGGLSAPDEVAAVLRAGADAVMVGTALLRSDESGASAVHQAAVADPGRGRTVLTRAFSGRPARGLENTFTRKYSELAPLGYPALHHLTSGLRKAATAAGNPELVHLWAGTGYRNATTGPAETILTHLASAI